MLAAVAALIFSVLLQATATAAGPGGTTSPRQAFVPVMRVGDVLPDLPLLDQNGKALSLRRSGGPSIVSFVYTRCADANMCPLVTSKFARLQTLIRGTGIRLVEITLDPAYDRPPVLRRYAAAAGAVAPNWVFATGRPADVRALGARLGIVNARLSAQTLAHSEAVAIVSGDGTLARLIDGDEWSARDVAAVARAEAARRPDPPSTFALALFARVGAACGARGIGGIPLIGALAIFAGSLALGAWSVVRLFPSLFENTSFRTTRRR